MKFKQLFNLILILFFANSCVSAQDGKLIMQKENLKFPELLVFTEEFETYFSSENEIEVIVKDKHFLEGPVWVDALNGLLFSDIPDDRVYFWNENDGLKVWLEPSGHSNGLTIDNNGDLLLMQGNHASTKKTKRQIGKIINPAANKTITDFITDYQGKKFNSPNDIVISSNGTIYFTDPPYGLIDGDHDSLKEMTFNGVYKVVDNSVSLLIDSIQRPNGIGLSPDNKQLYIGDSENGNVLAYELNDNGDIDKSIRFFDIKEIVNHSSPSTGPYFDGMTVSKKGVVILSGYNGLWFISPKGTLLGHIQTPEFTSNCTLDSKEEYIYWTSGKHPHVKGSSALGRYKLTK